ncbi:unnamed protein product, partial [Larinioides sclopetarius]
QTEEFSGVSVTRAEKTTSPGAEMDRSRESANRKNKWLDTDMIQDVRSATENASSL